MPKPQEPGGTFDLRVKSKLKEGRRLRVVEIQYVPTPDSAARLSRAIDTLLRAAQEDAEKKAPPDQAPSHDAQTGGGEEDSSL